MTADGRPRIPTGVLGEAPIRWKIFDAATQAHGLATEGEDVVRPLRSLGTPIADILSLIPYLNLQQLPSPLALRNLCSSASRVHLAAPRFQNISTGHVPREMPWQSTEKEECM